MQSSHMDSQWAADNLQTIRTLMERSAIYRRALAPIMLSSGVIGIIAAVVPCFVSIRTNRGFALYWMSVSFIAMVTALLFVRRQALRDKEAFWTSPAKRVTEALQAPFIAGFGIGAFLAVFDHHLEPAGWIATGAWSILYGCGLNAAGFFTPRGVGLFGRILVLLGCGFLFSWFMVPGDVNSSAHFAMGFVFGVLHLTYGIYLYFTERKNRP
jgi:hypothetical protein